MFIDYNYLTAPSPHSALAQGGVDGGRCVAEADCDDEAAGAQDGGDQQVSAGYGRMGYGTVGYGRMGVR